MFTPKGYSLPLEQILKLSGIWQMIESQLWNNSFPIDK